MKYLGYNLKELMEKERFIERLPRRKKQFVELFTTLHSVPKVAKILGIKVSSCYALLQKEEIQKAISYMQELIAFRNVITQDYFIDKLREIIENDDTKVKEKIDALALLARITGHIKEKQETTATMVVVKQEGFKISPAKDDDIIIEED